MTNDLTAIEIHSVNTMDSIVRGKQWRNMLETFYKTNSPRFKNFNHLISKNGGDGKDNSPLY